MEIARSISEQNVHLPETESYTPTVSIVIPTRNKKELLKEALQSVWDQELPENCGIEIIIVDDGSNDGTVEYLQSDSFNSSTQITLVQTSKWGEYVPQAPIGCGRARNAGIERAKGEYIAFLDADDLLLPGSIAKRLTYLQEHKETALVYTDEIIESNGKSLEKTRFKLWNVDKKSMKRYDHPNFIQPQTPIQFSSVMVRRKLFEQVGLFADDLLGHEDSDICHRIAERLPEQELGYLEEPLTIFRWGADPNHSLDITNQQFFIDEGRKYLFHYYQDRYERGLTVKEKVMLLESVRRLNAFQEVFNDWKEGFLSDDELHNERQKIFKWVEYR